MSGTINGGGNDIVIFIAPPTRLLCQYILDLEDLEELEDFLFQKI